MRSILVLFLFTAFTARAADLSFGTAESVLSLPGSFFAIYGKSFSQKEEDGAFTLNIAVECRGPDGKLRNYIYSLDMLPNIALLVHDEKLFYLNKGQEILLAQYSAWSSPQWRLESNVEIKTNAEMLSDKRMSVRPQVIVHQ